MAKSVELSNGRTWKAQSHALDHFKAMLHRYRDEDVVTDRNDHEDLIALLERYDLAPGTTDPKIGSGVEYLFRRLNKGEGYSSPGFWLRRTDGTETDFSYIHAVRQQHKGPAREFYDACRLAVQADLVAAKKEHFRVHGDAAGTVACDITGARITFGESHLDHAYPTFGQLVVAYRAAKGWGRAIPDGIVTPSADAQTRSSFIHEADRTAFRDYHHAAATLRVVHRQANLSLSASQRRPVIRTPVPLKAAA